MCKPERSAVFNVMWQLCDFNYSEKPNDMNSVLLFLPAAVCFVGLPVLRESLTGSGMVGDFIYRKWDKGTNNLLCLIHWGIQCSFMFQEHLVTVLDSKVTGRITATVAKGLLHLTLN